MTPRQLLQAAMDEPFVFDGEPTRLTLVPPGGGMNEHDFRTRFQRPMPAEIRDLLDLASEFHIGYKQIRFTEYRFQGYDFLIPDWVEVCEDGLGNHWIAEIQDRTHEWAPVWFASHDPPVLVFVAATLAEFIDQVLDAHRASPRLERNGYAESHDDAMRVWKGAARRPMDAAAARASPDPVIAALAAGLPGHGVVIDMRGCRQGEGFVWDGLDAGQPVRRGADPMAFGMVRDGEG